ncbi:unnamed protein product [Peronospora effusa]|nr:unnamed protein product [Peronospora effusa]
MMMNKKPNLHGIKKFGSLFYVHQANNPSRKKLDDNCRIGFLLGYLEGQAGFKAYFPADQVVQHVLDASINEDIVYGDRYHEGYAVAVSDWLSRTSTDDENGASMEVDSNDESIASDEDSMEVDSNGDSIESDDDSIASDCESIPIDYESESSAIESSPKFELVDVDSVETKIDIPVIRDTLDLSNQSPMCVNASDNAIQEHHTSKPSSLESETTHDTETDVDSQSAAENCDKVSCDYRSETSDTSNIENEDENVHADTELPTTSKDTVHLREGATTSESSNDLMDTCMIPEIITGERRKVLDAELENVQEIKRRRDNKGSPQKMVLRQSTERRYPSWLEGYLVNAALHENSESLTANHRWRANETKIPKSFTEAMKTPQKHEWYNGMKNEVNAMFSKEVLVPVDETEASAKANKLGLMWRFQVKTDDQEFITRFRPRLVGLGNHQQPGIDYVESF